MLHRNTEMDAKYTNNNNKRCQRVSTTGILRNTDLFYSCNVAHAAAAYVFSTPWIIMLHRKYRTVCEFSSS